MPIFLGLTLDVFIFAIGGLIFCLMGNLLVKSLAPQQKGALGFVTTILTAVPASLLKLSQKVVSTFAPATYPVQRRLAGGVYEAATLIDDAADVIQSQGAILAALAAALAGTATSAEIAAATAGLTKRVGNAEAQARGIGADVLPRISAVEKGIGADVLPKIAALDRAVSGIEGRALPRVNSRVSAADRAIGHLWDWVRSHTVDVATTAFAGAVAVALGRLGGGWIRCGNWGKLGKTVCGLPFGLLDDLLLTSITALAATDICDFADAAGALATTLRPVLLELVDVENALVGCHGATAPPAIRLPANDFPPVTDGLTLAA